MRTLEEHQEQLDLLIKALEASLVRLLSKKKGKAVNTAIYLHCAMIVFYKDFQKILCKQETNPIEFLNLAHLYDEFTCTGLFNSLDVQYQFISPAHVTSPELFFLVKLSTVIMSEAQNTLKKLDDKKKNFDTRGRILLISAILTMVALKLIEAVFPTFIALPALMPFIIGVIFLLLLGAGVSLCQGVSTYKHSLKIQSMFSTLWQKENLDDLDREIRRKKGYIQVEPNCDIPPIPQLLRDNECGKNTFRIVQPLFFNLDKKLTIVQEDLGLTSRPVI